MTRPWKVLAITAGAAFMSFLDATIVNIAFPDIRASFPAASISGLSWVLNAYSIVFAAFLVPAGRLADRYGRRRLFLLGLAVFSIASALAAAAPSPEALVATRVVQAIGAAILTPTSLALLLPEFPVTRRALAVGLWGAAGAVAAATGPPLGGLLVDQAGWRWVFLVNLPIGAAAWIAGRRVLRESRDPEARSLPDVAGAVLLAVAVGLLALGLVEGEAWGWTDWRIVASFAGAAALAPVVVRRSMRHRAPVLDLALFRVRSFAVANAATLVFGAAFYAMLLAGVLFLTSVWGYSTLEAGLALAPGPLMAALFAGPAGRLADRVGQRPIVVPGALVYAAGLAWFAGHVGTHPDYVGEWLPGQLLTGIGVGLTFPTLSSAAAAALPPARFGVGAAITATSRQIGAVLGVALLVAIVGTPGPADALGAFHHAWTVIALGGVATSLAGLLLGPRLAVAAGARAPAEAGA